MPQTPERPKPDWWPELEPVRRAAEAGQLTLGRCSACEQAHYYPRPLCPFCLASARFEAARGDGVIYSLSVVRRGPGAPSGVGYVTLSEGVSILVRLDGDLDALRIGDPVRLQSMSMDDDGLVPVFARATLDEIETAGAVR